MKKVIKIAAIVFTVFSITGSVSILAKTKAGYQYKETKKSITITCCKNNKKTVVIPDKIAGKNVTKIAAGAFSKMTKMKKIILPKHLKSIEKFESYNKWGDFAKKKNIVTTPFSGCSSLEKIQVKKGNKKFSSVDGVLYSKDKKNLLIYPAGSKRKNYKINNATTKITEAAFENTKRLKSFSYGKKLEDIHDGAFFASGVTKVVLNHNVNSIGQYVFSYCQNLKQVDLGSKIYYFYDHFLGCTNLEAIKVNNNKKYYDKDGILYEKEDGKKYLLVYPSAKVGEEFVIPEGVITGGRCFSYLKYLKKITYNPNGSLGEDFFRCKNITVILPKVITDPSKGEESDSYDGKWEPFCECENITKINA